jgi:hypothetical protein
MALAYFIDSGTSRIGFQHANVDGHPAPRTTLVFLHDRTHPSALSSKFRPCNCCLPDYSCDCARSPNCARAEEGSRLRCGVMHSMIFQSKGLPCMST